MATTTAVRRTAGEVNAAQPKQALRKAPFQIESGLHVQSYLKLLVYGESGVGKTKLVGTSLFVPEMQDVLLLNADVGELTLTSDPDFKSDLDKFAAVRVKDWGQFARVYDYLKAHCAYRESDEEKLKELQDKYMPGSKRLYKFKTVIIDSITEVEAFSMNMAMGVQVDGALDEETPTSNWDEIRQNRSNILRMARQFRDLPMNVLITAGRTMKEDEAKRTSFMPDLTGSLREKLPHYMDVVGYMVVGTRSEGDDKFVVRRLHIQPVGKWIAKCRFSALKGNFLDDPTIPNIMEGVGLS